jgi:hypothetical protein
MLLKQFFEKPMSTKQELGFAKHMHAYCDTLFLKLLLQNYVTANG